MPQCLRGKNCVFQSRQPDIRRKYVDMSLEDSSCGAKRVKLSNSVESKNEHLKKKYLILSYLQKY
ncbi:hypothetical protein IEQ34_009927 [Dendrobium chrysotoxum]|uniref:Uncharacterized protein n=1 Tax=Dendrobium chrysotoxum TaxID=161865 RepID=A0AAV7H214_DENCH|nr:hypothetical protein IEQ34_009927 [Dendrobium chrysotoxum]